LFLKLKRGYNFLKFLTTLGTLPTDKNDTTRRLVFLNRVTLLMALPGIPYVLIFYWMGYVQLSVLVLFFVSLYYVCLFFNYLSFTELGKWGLILSTNTAVFTFSNILGLNAGIHLIVLSLAVMSMCLFPANQTKRTFFAFLISSTNFFLMLFMSKYSLFPITINFSSSIYYSMFWVSSAVCLTILYLSIKFYISLNFESESLLAKTNENLMLTNLDLVDTNAKLQLAFNEIKEKQSLVENLSSQASFATLTRSIAHEIKNPLGMLLSNSELAMAESFDETSHNEFVKTVYDVSIRLQGVVGSMLQFGTPVSMKKQNVDLSQLLNDVLLLANSELKMKNITVSKHFEQNLPMIFSDPHSLSQVFINLLVNAIQALTKQGKISLYLNKDSFQSKSGKTIEAVKVTLQDNGSGIEKERLKTLFETTFTTKDKNTGLGLQFVKTVLDQNEGKIEVNSDLNKGTQFVLYFPVSNTTESIQSSVPFPQKQTTLTKSEKPIEILLVEDEPVILKTTARGLYTQHKIKVHKALNQTEARALFIENQGSIDVIVSDFHLGDITGLGLYSKLMEINNKPIPLVILSADASLSDLVSKDAKALVDKPFVFDMLAQAIYWALDPAHPFKVFQFQKNEN